ncbi:MAG: hypothetical protein K0S71_1444 [Clostridia bacterium]|jgi:prepilin-type N-terminal cleavage/methylation domain-containing protein|nr:hypothetical protein [Clostridia bacterium]
MKQTQKKNEKGFTMIELIIVVAIMGIIGAVLVPMFGNMSLKARLTTDVTSVKTLQRQLDIFKAETGAYPGGFSALNNGAVTAVMLDELVDGQYIDDKDLESGLLKLQTGGTLMADDEKCYLSFDSSTEQQEYVTLVGTLDAKDTTYDWVRNGTAEIAPPASGGDDDGDDD